MVVFNDQNSRQTLHDLLPPRVFIARAGFWFRSNCPKVYARSRRTLSRWLQLALQPTRDFVGLQRIRAIAVKTSRPVLPFSVRRQRHCQSNPALRASRSISVAHGVNLPQDRRIGPFQMKVAKKNTFPGARFHGRTLDSQSGAKRTDAYAPGSATGDVSGNSLISRTRRFSPGR
jgi:hypothetical protein